MSSSGNLRRKINLGKLRMEKFRIILIINPNVKRKVMNLFLRFHFLWKSTCKFRSDGVPSYFLRDLNEISKPISSNAISRTSFVFNPFSYQNGRKVS